MLHKKYPVVDIGRCSLCMGCVEIAPEVFVYTEIFGMIQVVDLEDYSGKGVEDALLLCPEDCISWDEI